MGEVATVERPILFSTLMVSAILDGRKTQTRRVVKLRRGQQIDNGAVFSATDPFWMVWPNGNIGDRLWVRERFGIDNPKYLETYKAEPWRGEPDRDNAGVHYFERERRIGSENTFGKKFWKSSIHMPRWACRIVLEITDVRVQRLHDIGKDGRQARDVLAEGITREAIERQQKFFHVDDSPAIAFSQLWESINGKKYPWASNPWVWAITFKRIDQ